MTAADIRRTGGDKIAGGYKHAVVARISRITITFVLTITLIILNVHTIAVKAATCGIAVMDAITIAVVIITFIPSNAW